MFEFDPDKSDANRAKHGIDFEEGQSLWLDDRRFTIESHYVSERRWTVVGSINGKLWAAVITRRDDAVRIISVRRARIKEELKYHDQNDQRGGI